MKVTEELQKIDLTGTFMEGDSKYEKFNIESEFIDDTLEVLASDNLAHKKNYFLDNQVEIIDSVDNLKELLNFLSPSVLTEEDAQIRSDVNVRSLTKLVGITIKRLENGIGKFNQELQVSASTIKNSADGISITEDTIKDAMQNNEGTKQISQDLKDMKNQNIPAIDEYTKKIQEDFDNFIQQKKSNSAQQKSFVPQKKLQKKMYAIFSRDGMSYQVIEGAFTKEQLNQEMLRSGLDRPRLYELVEIPTVQKTVKQVVSVIQ